MRGLVIFFFCCTCAFITPLITRESQPDTSSMVIPGWPDEFDGKKLIMLPLTEREKRFDFPGKIGRFTDGNREIIIRRITTHTRLLHSSSDCFRGLGYRIEPQPAVRNKFGSQWSSFKAIRHNEKLLVYERIFSADGKSWTDVSAWYWNALMNKSAPPWTAITVAEQNF